VVVQHHLVDTQTAERIGHPTLQTIPALTQAMVMKDARYQQHTYRREWSPTRRIVQSQTIVSMHVIVVLRQAPPHRGMAKMQWALFRQHHWAS
jgi:hypothetical protein